MSETVAGIKRTHVVTKPTGVSSGIALAAGLGALWLIADHIGQLRPLGVLTAGVLVIWVATLLAPSTTVTRVGEVPDGGDVLEALHEPDLSLLLAAVGGCLTAVALGLGVVTPATPADRIELLPGMIGVAVLAVGVFPLRERWARRLVTVGAAAIVVSVLTSGVLYGIGRLQLLAALALAIVAWDAAEHAINLGEHVGRGAATLRVELLHSAGTLVVGAIAVVVANTVFALGIEGLPLMSLALLLATAVALAAALYLYAR